MQRRTMRQTTYEYLWPFEYPNFTIRSTWWGERHGRELDLPPAGYITVVEEQPIVAVTVIGSACSPPGWIMIEGERIETPSKPRPTSPSACAPKTSGAHTCAGTSKAPCAKSGSTPPTSGCQA